MSEEPTVVENDDEFWPGDDFETEFVEPPEWMSARELLNLEAIADTTDALGHATFQVKKNWPLHRRLVRNGYVTWRPHPKMGRHFAAVDVTEKALHLLSHTMEFRRRGESIPVMTVAELIAGIDKLNEQATQ